MRIRKQAYQIDVPNKIIEAFLIDTNLLEIPLNKDSGLQVLNFEIIDTDELSGSLKIDLNGEIINLNLNQQHLEHEFLKEYIKEKPTFKEWLQDEEINEAFIQVYVGTMSFKDKNQEEAVYHILDNYELNLNLVEEFIESDFDPNRCEYVLNYKFNKEISEKIMEEAPEHISEQYKNLYLDDLYGWEKILSSGNFNKILDLYNKAKHSDSEQKSKCVWAIVKDQNMDRELHAQLLLYFYHDCCNNNFEFSPEIIVNTLLSYKHCPLEVFEDNLEYEGPQLTMLRNENTPSSIIEKLSEIVDQDKMELVAEHKNCPKEIRAMVIKNIQEFESIINELNPIKIREILYSLPKSKHSNSDKLKFIKILISKETCFSEDLEMIYNLIKPSQDEIVSDDKLELLKVLINNPSTPLRVKEEIVKNNSNSESNLSSKEKYRFLSGLNSPEEIISFAKDQIDNLNFSEIKNNDLFSFNSLPVELRTLFYNKESSTLNKDSLGNMVINKDNMNFETLTSVTYELRNKFISYLEECSYSSNIQDIDLVSNLIEFDNDIFELFELDDDSKAHLKRNLQKNLHAPMSIVRNQ